MIEQVGGGAGQGGAGQGGAGQGRHDSISNKFVVLPVVLLHGPH